MLIPPIDVSMTPSSPKPLFPSRQKSQMVPARREPEPERERDQVIRPPPLFVQGPAVSMFTPGPPPAMPMPLKRQPSVGRSPKNVAPVMVAAHTHRHTRTIIENQEAVSRQKQQLEKDRLKEKREKSELCVKYLRFVMWRNYVELKQAQRIRARRASRDKLANAVPSHYGITRTLDVMEIDSVYKTYPAPMVQEATAAENELAFEGGKDWLQRSLVRRILGDEQKKPQAQYWVKLAICVDISHDEANMMNSWLVRQLTEGECKLTNMDPFQCCIFRRAGVQQANFSLSYCVNLAYQTRTNDKYWRKGLDSLHGTRVLVFAMSCSIKEDAERFAELMGRVPKRAEISVVILYSKRALRQNDPEIAALEGKAIQQHLENVLRMSTYQEKTKQIGYYRFRHLKYHPDAPENMLLPLLADTLDKAVQNTELSIHVAFLHISEVYRENEMYKTLLEMKQKRFQRRAIPAEGKFALTMQKMTRQDLESLNYFVTYYNAITEAVSRRYRQGTKQRTRLVPEFLTAQGKSVPCSLW